VIPIHSGHGFRRKPATYSDEVGHPLRGGVADHRQSSTDGMLLGNPGERHASPETADASGSRGTSPQARCGAQESAISPRSGSAGPRWLSICAAPAVVGITWPVPGELDDATLEGQLFSPPFVVCSESHFEQIVR
jgi:hypothetical protein